MIVVIIFTVIIASLILIKFFKNSDKNLKQNISKNDIRIYYGTQSGKSKSFAEKLQNKLKQSRGFEATILNIAICDPDEQFSTDLNENKCIALFIVSTYTDGTPPEAISWFCKWLNEAAHDFRVQKSMLMGMRYAVFGLGDSVYKDNFNVTAENIDTWLHKLSASRMFPMGQGDENCARQDDGSQESDFEDWSDNICDVIESLKKDNSNNDVAMESENLVESSSEEESEKEDEKEDSSMVDVEDIGPKFNSMKNGVVKNGEGLIKRKRKPKEMISPQLRTALTKQGYKLVGTHSGVKLCRWTKSMLRGRGGCYKHTFYGIASHQCMETTPSLACANKCVFCWRHHTNPVGTEWKWQMDEPELIVESAIKNHYSMIKEFKGVPGVKPERFAEGFSIQHCALSLVGEPIMYPKINEFIELLHKKGISSFLVTNAQFPDAITNLEPVTQLYVSVDAATPESLKKIDRPLFKDYWPRFVDSLKALGTKGQRTVYRLTVVKAWNDEEIESYANLVNYGNPDFIEIKGVTYCGNVSTSGGLTLKNVPWHEEVLYFSSKLAERLENYEVACEHEHSNCILMANKKFKVDEKWMTWINYERFHELFQRYKADGTTFTASDYMADTPSWATIGAQERGFDPIETRWRRKGNKEVEQGC